MALSSNSFLTFMNSKRVVAQGSCWLWVIFSDHFGLHVGQGIACITHPGASAKATMFSHFQQRAT